MTQWSTEKKKFIKTKDKFMSQPNGDAEIESRKEDIIDNLTLEQEETLRQIHGEQCEGVLDDDMPDDYENWLEDLNLMDLEAYLEL